MVSLSRRDRLSRWRWYDLMEFGQRIVTSEFELSVTSKMANLTVISDFVTSVAKKLCLDDDQTFALQMAVDEACANIIEHAYEGKADGTISIRCRIVADDMVVTIHDHGRVFDPDSVPRPDIAAPLEERETGGLGLYLMEKLMDSVEWEFDPKKGNTLTMRKRRVKSPV
jgi:serine/threonine-protein kinase RsbW